MGELDVQKTGDGGQMRSFMKALLGDLRALETMLDNGMIETGKRRIGVEQEMFLVDSASRAAPIAMEVLERINDPHFTTELARFNLEFNMDPLALGYDCLSRLEAGLNEHMQKARDAAQALGADVFLTGILPTLNNSDLGLENMTPMPRYYALNDALHKLRGEAFEFRFSGTDDLIIKHDSVMLEACNTSFQVHFQADPSEFAKLYNIAQAVTAPLLAVATNSPMLFGRRLLMETRIALFQQAVDTRRTGYHLHERNARVSFGRKWLKDSILEVYRDDVARFRVLMGAETQEDPFEAIRQKRPPGLKALQLHNGTIYRWNRPCYGYDGTQAHLRIENRVLPSGPTVVDEVANVAFFLGLMSGVLEEYGDVTKHLCFESAKDNFLAAARVGLGAQFTWLGGKRIPAENLVRQQLLPLAREGLKFSGIVAADIDKYLGIIEQRVESGQTGAQWMLDSMARLSGRAARGENLAAVTKVAIKNQKEGRPVHEWPLAELDQPRSWKLRHLRVEQYMTTDLFTVSEDELVDLVANLMDWERIRHVPVENNQHELVGLISYRSLIRLLGRNLIRGDSHISVREIMNPDPVTVAPETGTLHAIRLMREHKVACLPVVKDRRLVGIVSERDFVNIAADLIEKLFANE